jgi:phage shock protein C
MRNKYETGARRPLYRSRNGVIFGVCRGFAEYHNLSLFWLRAGVVLVTVLGGLWPAIIYVGAALMMKIEPVLPLESAEDREFYHSFSGSRSMALERLKRTYDNLDRRIQRLEGAVTASDYDWDERLNS